MPLGLARLVRKADLSAPDRDQNSFSLGPSGINPTITVSTLFQSNPLSIFAVRKTAYFYYSSFSASGFLKLNGG